MKFGLLGILQLPRPWQADSELKLFQHALEQVELSDRLGIEYLWQVELHSRLASLAPPPASPVPMVAEADSRSTTNVVHRQVGVRLWRTLSGFQLD